MFGWASLECIWSSVTNCRLSATIELESRYSDLLRKLRGFHFGFDDFQSDCSVAEVLMVEQFGAVAYSKAAFSQLMASFILQTLWIAHQLGWRVGVDRRGRHWVVEVVMVAVMEQRAPKLCLFGSLLGELWTRTVHEWSSTHDPCEPRAAQ